MSVPTVLKGDRWRQQGKWKNYKNLHHIQREKEILVPGQVIKKVHITICLFHNQCFLDRRKELSKCWLCHPDKFILNGYYLAVWNRIDWQFHSLRQSNKGHFIFPEHHEDCQMPVPNKLTGIGIAVYSQTGEKK